MSRNRPIPENLPREAVEILQQYERATIGCSKLVALLRERILADGPLTFADFMRLVLYHPLYGYYNSPATRFGREGDFLTAPETHPAFGALICRWLVGLWARMGTPAPFTVVEAGAGRGTLARQVCRYARERYPEFAGALDYVLVEKSAVQRARQREVLGTDALSFRSLECIGALAEGSVQGCLLSNELLDALPVHRVQNIGGTVHEIYVGLRDDDFVELHGPLSIPAVADYLSSAGIELAEGMQAEVGLEAVQWYQKAASRIARGAILTIDYGYWGHERQTRPGCRDTLLCYYRHSVNEAFYRRLGTQDITAHVDFEAIARAGEKCGLETCGFWFQSEWLRQLGVTDWLEGREPWPEDACLRRSDLQALVSRQALGKLRVMVQAKRLGCRIGD